ncbi:PRC and DUF2382 domain-containing protein [Actinomycetospora callitridis]|uniref:PRC and DUF2382 domain-containing protein n=1 Tax=Actinomycetospora callitridis TaxID=913944 RepID=UPI0023665FF1|nr:PRC and DUF2382 domain-containing protein [Actinomycetospora callitridis]MDD7919105.1 PRC and DUF2382 domain-containing protein [Actinomycetospora callitridis]
MTVNLSDPREMYGAAVTGSDGEKLGKVDTVYLDNQTQRPEWAAVTTGLFGSHVSLVPLATAHYDNGHLQVPFSKDEVRNAPHHDPGQQLSVDDERQLFAHYGVDYGGDTATARTDDSPTGGDQVGRRERDEHTAAGTGQSRGTERRGTERDGEHEGAVGHDTSGPTTDQAMTRSEEELRVGTQTQERGRARLRKYVVTENVTQTVPVSREEVRVEREPITEANAPAAHDGPSISEEEHEVVLHEERPVVGKETVAKERVRMDTETHRDHEQISDEVRKEQIEATDETQSTGTTDGRTGSAQTRR